MKKTKSTNYLPCEIKGILPDGTIILHEGVKKDPFTNYLRRYEDGQINTQLIFKEKYYDAMYRLFGEGDPELSVME